MIALERPNEDAEVELQATHDRALPEHIPSGQDTAVFCVGTCCHPRQRVVDLMLTVGGSLQRPLAQGMPRPDAPSYRSGFWAIVPVEARAWPTELEVKAEARLADGTTRSAVLGTIKVVERPDPPAYDGLPRAGRRPLIAICMATYNPTAELFRAQVESIRAQTDGDWVCLISDDCSEPARFAEIVDVVGDDPRFVVSRSDVHLSFYRNFERALGMVPADAELVALSDHDDRWYPEKLETLRDAIGSSELAYSDVRRVDAEGVVRGKTLWEGRRNNRDNLASLLISNTIVGASCLFRRRVIDHALPFPAGPGWDFHDHWLAFVAMALGDVAYVDRPLYDYVQHPRAVLGRVASNQETLAQPTGLRGRLRRRRRYFDRWRSAYFLLYLQRELMAKVLLVRCGRQLTPGKHRALRRLIAADRSPLAFAWLALRPARALFGRNETLGIESMLARGVLWRRLIGLRARAERPGSSSADASMPAFDPDLLGSRQRRWLARR